MGACFGLFKKKSKKRSFKLQRCVYMRDDDRIELELLVGEDGDMTENEESDVWTMSGKLATKFPSDKFIKVKGRLLDKSLVTKSRQCLLENLRNEDLEGSQIVPLDAHTLLASRAIQKRKISVSSSTPPSSVDLEWENEGFSHALRLKSHCSTYVEDVSSCSGCGEGSPPESLEWDPCDPSAHDFETEELINEIEQLTSRALEETGDWTNR